MKKIINEIQESFNSIYKGDFDWRKKRCKKCGEVKQIDQFFKKNHTKDGRSGACRVCDTKVTRSSQVKNRDRLLSTQAAYRHKARADAVEHYGGKCACCGESHKEFLAIDHIEGGGTKHRKEINGMAIGIWLRKNNYPSGFIVLCHNCNMARGFLGYCPHERERKP